MGGSDPLERLFSGSGPREEPITRFQQKLVDRLSELKTIELEEDLEAARDRIFDELFQEHFGIPAESEAVDVKKED